MQKKSWLPLLLIGLAAAIAIPSVIQLATRQTPAPEPALPRSAETTLPVWPSKPTTSANPSDTPAQSLASNPELTLTQIFAEIEQNNLGLALQHTETLIERYPNYRLAHLIKGDLLLARRHPLTTFGAAPSGTEKISDLRA